MLFLLTVVAPTLIASAHFMFSATDVYVSESRFVIRNTEQQSGLSSLGQILKGVGFSRSQDDSYTVRDYMLSRDAVEALERRLGLVQMFSAKDVDLISRFPRLDNDRSFEALFEYYKGHVSVQIETDSPVVVLQTRAFTAQDSFLLNQELLEMGEDFVNRLNERARRDLIDFATKEVETAEKRSRAAALALANFRNAKGVIDPEKQSALPLQQAARLQDELIETKAKIAQIEMLARDNPQIGLLRQRAKLLETEIAAASARVTGGERSLATKAGEYQHLLLEKEFSEKMLASTMSSLEMARNEARRKNAYLSRVSSSSFPDESTEPKRMRAVAAVFMVGLVMWGILGMLISGIKEHQD
jgi:capsular polysaccharide transport system permease protein